MIFPPDDERFHRKPTQGMMMLYRLQKAAEYPQAVALLAFLQGYLELPWPLAALLACLSLLPHLYFPIPGSLLGLLGAMWVWRWPFVPAFLFCFSWLILYIISVIITLDYYNRP